MKKILIFAATAAVVLASCARTEDTLKSTGQGTPVSFGVYTSRNATKVGGEAGDQTLAKLGKTAGPGFGVFCFYSNNSSGGNTNDYDAGSPSNFTPNFMWNQQVKGNGDGSADPTAWTYEPVKYWPNEYTAGVTDQGIDKLTFFAYAPWVDATKTTGAVGAETEGITTLSDYDDTGDPTLTYVIPADVANHVDVLYADATSLKNLTKPAGNTAVSFPFKHALTSVVFRVQAYVDSHNNTGNLSDEGYDIASGTTVTLKEIYFGGSTIYPSGTLNLATGVWTPAAAASKTFSKTGLTQNVTKTKAAVTGIDAITMIPNTTSTAYNIRVVYDVVTTDSNLNGGNSTVTNDIKNTLNLSLAAGKRNIIDLVLGLYSVKVTASVADWEDATAVEVDLPENN